MSGEALVNRKGEENRTRTRQDKNKSRREKSSIADQPVVLLENLDTVPLAVLEPEDVDEMQALLQRLLVGGAAAVAEDDVSYVGVEARVTRPAHPDHSGQVKSLHLV